MTTPLEAQDLAKRLRAVDVHDSHDCWMNAHLFAEAAAFLEHPVNTGQGVTDEEVEHMVHRFLQWKLPEPWYPDCGISFDNIYRSQHGPVGTNLFDYTQAKAMVRHMIEGIPLAARTPLASVEGVDYDRGRRDVLNAILALNPKAAQRLHMVSGGTEETFANHDGRLPFDVVFWVTEVAEQLGIEPKGGE